MKKIILPLLCLLTCLTVNAESILEGQWDISFDSNTKVFIFNNNGKNIFNGVYSKAKYYIGDDTTLIEQDTKDAESVESTKTSIKDNFGEGIEYVYTYSFSNGTTMKQIFCFYDDLPYFVVRLAVSNSKGKVKSNFMSPIYTTTRSCFLPTGYTNHMLFIPWDNDAWVRYQSYYVNRTMTSFSATAIFDGDTRKGIVVGAVDHDTWKSAIHVEASDYKNINTFYCLSGYTSDLSRDVLPHGKVVGDTVKSSRFIVGYFDDWRTGMETYGQACTKVVPRRAWEHGSPVGWNSWGVMQEKVSYQGVCDVQKFIKDSLMTHGFYDSRGKVVISLDAWWNDNFTDDQLKAFVKYCNENNMIPGLYYGPFCDFTGYDHDVTASNGKYKYSDLWMKVNGEYYKIDGSNCLDPTHPGTKMAIMSQVQKLKNLGIKYLKCDFMCDGAIEADSHYNKNVTTGIQAYNEGMAFLIKQLGDSIYLDLSISPIFPYQYAQGRRISCDAYSTISSTEYVMNSTSYGWWLNQIYAVNDPDNLVLKAKDQKGSESNGVNRARVTSGAVTGSFFVGDNFSSSVEYGFPELSKTQASKMFTNEDINEIPRTCGTFMPVEGYKADVDGAESLFKYETDKYLYFAVINYKTLVYINDSITFERLGIDASNVGEIKELWSETEVTPTAKGVSYKVPGTDARIFRITKNGYSGINNITPSDNSIELRQCDGQINISSSNKLKNVSIYCIDGKIISDARCSSYSLSIPTSSFKQGLYIVKAKTDNNIEKTLKISVK